MFQDESSTANEKLVQAIKDALPKEESQDEGYESRTPSASDNNQAAFQVGFTDFLNVLKK